MSKKMILKVLALVMVAAMALGACAPAVTNTPAAQSTATTAAAEPTATTAAAEPTATTAAAEPTATTAAETSATATVPVAASGDLPYENVDPTGQKIVFWHNQTGSKEDALKAIVDDFNKTNQYGITLEAINQGSYGDIFNKIMPILNTADMPNLVVAYQNQAATYQLAGALVDMNPMVNSPKWGLTPADQKDFFPSFWKQDVFPTYGGARLGFPPNRSEEVMYYNLDWLKEMGYDGPPTTPDQFKEMACKASKTPFSKATGTGGSFGYELSVDASRFASWTFAFGGHVYDDSTNQYTLNNDGAVQAMQFIQSLFKDGCASLPAEQYGDQTDFGTGNLLFAVGSTSGLSFYQSAVDAGAKFDWSIGALPHTTPDPVMNIYGSSISIPKSTPEKELASWIFLKYFTSPAVNAKWAQTSQYYPSRISAAQDLTDYMSKNPAYKTGYDLLKYGAFEPPVPGYDFVRTMIQDDGMSVIIAEPYPDVKTVLDKVNEEANANLQEQLQQIKK